MMRHLRAFATVLSLVTLTVSTASGRLAAQSATPPAAAADPTAPVALTAADAKPLLGDWTIAADGMQGAATFTLTLKAEGDRTVGALTSDVAAPVAITDITKAGATVILRYAFDYEGNSIPVVVTLTPTGDTLGVSFDFAGGAYTMPGTATRKKS